MMGFFACVYAVNRRVGGLEMEYRHAQTVDSVNRRVGGLEKFNTENKKVIWVNRRVGGLESKPYPSL